jgi:hypothetical protein
MKKNAWRRIRSRRKVEVQRERVRVRSRRRVEVQKERVGIRTGGGRLENPSLNSTQIASRSQIAGRTLL